MRKALLLLFFFCCYASVWSQSTTHLCQSGKKLLPLRGGSVLDDPGNARSDTVDILHYDLNLDFTLMDDDQLKASCTISFVSLINDLDVLHLDLLGLTVDSVTTAQGLLGFSHSNESLLVSLLEPLDPSQSTELTIHYHGSPTSDPTWGGFYFASGYAYNLGVGFTSVPHNLGRVWFPCFDNFVERSTYTFHVLTNNDRTAYCNGVLTSAEEIGLDSLLSHWELSQSIPTYLACVAVTNYTHVEQSYQSVLGNDIPMWLVAKPADTTDMKLSMINLPGCMQGFEDDYGPYRWSRVGFTAVPFNAGAMEHATSIAYPLITLDGSLTYETLMAHELSHHWWGDLVTCKNASDMWLNEGLAKFSEAIFIENQYGAEDYNDFIRDVMKDVLLFAHRNDGARYPVSGVPNTATYGDHVYNKGAVMAHNLRVYMGDKAFFEAIRNMMEDKQFTHHTSQDLRDYFQQYTSQDLLGFFDGWIFEPGLPEFRIVQSSQTGGNTWELTIQQFLHYAPTYYTEVPLHIKARSSAGLVWETTQNVSGELTVLNITVPEDFDPVVFFIDIAANVQYAVLDEEKTINDDGINNFNYAEMEIDVESLGGNPQLFLRVENHWAAADENLVQGDYYLSPDRWWNVWHDGTEATDITATLRYYGDEGSARYFDPLFFQYLEANNYNEDSLVLMHRMDGSSAWQVYSDFEVLTSPGIDNWGGRIRIYHLKSGQYAFAVPTGPTTIEETMLNAPLFFHNNNRIACRTGKQMGELTIFDISGKIVHQQQISTNTDVSTQAWSNGVYLLKWKPQLEFQEYSLKIIVD
jgi:hypothetical protein